MKKTLNNDVREAVYDRLKKGDTLIQMTMSLIKDNLMESLDDQGIAIIGIILNGALSQLNEAREMISKER